MQWEIGAGPKRTAKGKKGLMGKRKGELGGINKSRHTVRGLEVMSPSQLGRNYSLQLYPAETRDMEIHDCLNVWT